VARCEKVEESDTEIHEGAFPNLLTSFKSRRQLTLHYSIETTGEKLLKGYFPSIECYFHIFATALKAQAQ
jgi:hypothetical protein